MATTTFGIIVISAKGRTARQTFLNYNAFEMARARYLRAEKRGVLKVEDNFWGYAAFTNADHATESAAMALGLTDQLNADQDKAWDFLNV